MNFFETRNMLAQEIKFWKQKLRPFWQTDMEYFVVSELHSWMTEQIHVGRRVLVPEILFVPLFQLY